MKVSLRDAHPEDSEFVFSVRRSAFRPYLEQDSGWDDAVERGRHEERFARQRFRVVEVDDEDVGYIATATYSATDVYPESMYLHQLMLPPESQSQGIGASCFRTLCDEARAIGLPLRLNVLKVNPRARQFYERMGCEVIGDTETKWSLAWWT